MNKKYLVTGCVLTALIAAMIVYSLPPTFENELEYYREYTTTNLAWDNNQWIIRETSFWEYKAQIENGTGAECIFIKSTYKEVRETVTSYKAIYIWYDSNERIIWTVAPGEHTWIFPYWVAPEWRR